MVTRQAIIRTIIPHLFGEKIIRDQSSGQIMVILKGIPAENLYKASKSIHAFYRIIKFLQNYLKHIGFSLRGYIYQDKPYLTVISNQKFESYLDDNEAYVLGVFITFREQKGEELSWAELEKEFTDGAVIIKNARRYIEFLVNRGLLYRVSKSPLYFEYGPSFYLEFDPENIEKITLFVGRTILVSEKYSELQTESNNIEDQLKKAKIQQPMD